MGTKRWSFSNGSTVTLTPRLCLSTVSGTIQAAKRSLGLARTLSYQIGPDLGNGGLQTVLSDYSPTPIPINIVRAQGPLGAAKVRAFKDLAIAQLRDNPYLN